MAELKTKPGSGSVSKFLAGIADEATRKDCETLVKLMRSVTRAEPVMWGPSIVGFGTYHYVYESGREGDWFLAGFAPRKGNLTLYIMSGFPQHAALLKQLGKHKTGGSCLYVKHLADLDLKVLRQLVAASVREVKRRYGAGKGRDRAE
ncbi:MAG TPA: DUF1801 domain-containing protein [Gemmatimonadales bacterium]